MCETFSRERILKTVLSLRVFHPPRSATTVFHVARSPHRMAIGRTPNRPCWMDAGFHALHILPPAKLELLRSFHGGLDLTKTIWPQNDTKIHAFSLRISCWIQKWSPFSLILNVDTNWRMDPNLNHKFKPTLTNLILNQMPRSLDQNWSTKCVDHDYGWRCMIQDLYESEFGET